MEAIFTVSFSRADQSRKLKIPPNYGMIRDIHTGVMDVDTTGVTDPAELKKLIQYNQLHARQAQKNMIMYASEMEMAMGSHNHLYLGRLSFDKKSKKKWFQNWFEGEESFNFIHTLESKFPEFGNFDIGCHAYKILELYINNDDAMDYEVEPYDVVEHCKSYFDTQGFTCDELRGTTEKDVDRRLEKLGYTNLYEATQK